MSDDTFISFCSKCPSKCCKGTLEQLGAHQKQSAIKHKAIKQRKCHEKCIAFIGKIQKVSEPLTQLREHIGETFEKVIHNLQALKKSLLGKLDSAIPNYYRSKKGNIIKHNLEHLKANNYGNITCAQLDQVLDLIDQIVKDKQYESKQLQKNGKCAGQISQQFHTKFKDIFQKDKTLQAILFAQSTDFLSSFDESSIRQIDSSNSSSFKSTVSDLKKNIKESKPEKKKYVLAQDLFKEQSIQIEENSLEESNIYTQAQNKFKGNNILKSFFNEYDTSSSFKKKQSHSNASNSLDQSASNQPSIVSLKAQNSFKVDDSKIPAQSKLSSFLQSMNSRSYTYFQADEEEDKDVDEQLCGQNDENSDKLNETIQSIHLEIMNKAQPKSQSQFNGYLTIKELQEKNDEEMVFSIRVQIVKILYYSVMNKHIPKIKFIAGDKTGYGLFFTNFCPGMKVGTILDMYTCKFHLYQGSLQICNDQSFRILRSNPSNIKCNLNGVRLNKILRKDLYYPLMDIRCALVRQVCEKLRARKTFQVRRMYVQVVTILQEKNQLVFCLVGDSSGQMLAYLKKSHRKPQIKEGEVVRLLQVVGIRGKHKGSNHKGDILYIDSEADNSKVLPHGFQFCEISNDIITL